MTDHDAFLHAIIENPEEDTPRLVFADWLDEHAESFPTPAAVRSRAAFIRDDVAMSQRDEFDPLRLRWELIEKPQREAEAWVNETLPQLPDGTSFDRTPLLRRGFPWAVTINSAARVLPDPPANTVPLEKLSYNQCGYFGIDQLRTASWRGQIRSLQLERGNAAWINLRRLFVVDGLVRLENLALSRGAIHGTEVRELSASPLFARLTAFTITGTPCGPEVILGITHTGACALRRLALIDCRLTSGAVAALLESPTVNNLESLSLGGDRINAPGKFRAFGRLTHPTALRSLEMSTEAPNESGLEAFLSSALIPGLRRLALGQCNLNSARTKLLASGAFANLRVLVLNGNPVGNDGAAAIARSPHLAGLLVLDLAYAQVGDEGILAILESPLADGLVFLNLSGSPASAETKELLKAKMGDRVLV
jgi:uncharacterized protein (TIGR02996 family)